MSLATRCTACGTVFRVVHDQLKVSEGWVRCGKCQEVFSAMDGLFDLDLKVAAAMPAATGSGFAPSPAAGRPAATAIARSADSAPSGSTTPGRAGTALFDPPLFAPPEKSASMWRGRRGSDEAAPSAHAIERIEPPAPPAPLLDRMEPLGGRRAFEDDASDNTDALQIQPLEQDEAPFVLRRPAIEARAFDRPAGLRNLPGADALRRATEERDSHSETMPATFDRANVDDWRPSGADSELSDIAASRGLHIDLLIDDVDRPPSSTVTPPGSAPPSTTSSPSDGASALGVRADDETRDRARPAIAPAVSSPQAAPAAFDSHVLGGTLTDGSLEEHIADAADPPPAFLRDAERRSRRDTPRQRQWLIGVAAALAVAFGLQLVFHSRDVLAARFPAMSTPLAAMCALAGCTLGPPRRIDEVVVDSSALTRVEGMDAFQLTVVLRNRSSMPLAMPSIDLSLTDTDGQLVSRRALQPTDFASAGPALAASGEQTLKLLLSAGERRVTGYTVELFYP